jgi:hypothetical protein
LLGLEPNIHAAISPPAGSIAHGLVGQAPSVATRIIVADDIGYACTCKAMLDRAFALAIKRSGDYETAFLPEPFIDLLFTDPEGALEAKECWVGQVWHRLLEAAPG